LLQKALKKLKNKLYEPVIHLHKYILKIDKKEFFKIKVR